MTGSIQSASSAAPYTCLQRPSQLVAICTTLQERMSASAAHEKRREAGSTGCGDAQDPGVVGFKVKWQAVLGGTPGDDRLARRLAWSGWREADLATALADNEPAAEAGAGIPAWATIMDEVSELVARAFERESEGTHEQTGTDFAFQGLLEAIVTAAARQLRARLNRPTDALSPRLSQEAANELAYWLMRELEHILSPALYEQFDRSRPLLRSLMLRHLDREDPPAFEQYDAFIAECGRTGLCHVFASHPMLARLIGTRIETWIAAAAEFIERLESDWAEVGQLCGADSAEPVQRLWCGLSDSHHDGRSVHAVEFACGARVVYKPRDLRLDRELRRIATFLAVDTGLELVVPEVLVGTGYGWARFVKPSNEPCPPVDNAFWRNAGGLLAFMHLLGGNDIHDGNVIVAEKALSVIDTEAMFYRGHAFECRRPEAGCEFNGNVSLTGMLPHWSPSASPSSPRRDVSALGGLYPQPLARATPASPPASRWHRINSDDMCPGHWRQAKPMPDAADVVVPVPSGAIEPSGSTIAAAMEGFAIVYRKAVENRQVLLADLNRFSALPTRFIHRATMGYEHVLLRALEPDALTSGIAFGLQLEVLARAGSAYQDKPQSWPLYEDAIAQMSRLDIPYQIAKAGGLEILGSGSRVVGATWESGLAASARRISRLSEDDLRLQLEHVRATFEARRASHAGGRRAPSNLARNCELSAEQTEAFLAAQALKIAERVSRHAVRSGSRTIWLKPTLAHPPHLLEGWPTPLGLYEGACGTAIFLAAADRWMGERRFESVWFGALEPLRNASVSDEDAILRTDLGLANGLGGLLYTCAVLSRLVSPEHQDWLAAVARRIIEAVSQGAVESDQTFDLLGGSAGAILGLIAADDAFTMPEAVTAAHACASHLIAHYVPIADPDCEPGREWLCGMSHGAAGVGLAMGRLHARTGEAQYLTAVRRLLDFESRFYSPATCNWRDLREKADSGMSSWCHGAPGIALARLALTSAGLGCCDNRIERDWRRAMGSLGQQACHLDHACCGLMGHCEALVALFEATGDTPALQRARNLAVAMMHDAQDDGELRLLDCKHGPLFNPAFFQGLSGIGYGLLRCAAPGMFPSILSFNAGTTDLVDLAARGDARIATQSPTSEPADPPLAGRCPPHT